MTTLPQSLDWLKHWSTETPGAVALQMAGSKARYTYLELYNFSCALAEKLKLDHGLSHGDRVAILSTNELEYVALFFAIQRIGAIMVPLNYRYTPRELEAVIKNADPKLLIVHESYLVTASQFMTLVPTVSLKTVTENWTASDSVTSNVFAGGTDDACMILYTSGTTGEPKGVVVTNRMITTNSLSTGERLNLKQDDVNLAFLPFFHTSGWNVLLTPFIHHGARTVLMRKFDAEKVLAAAECEGVTVLFGVPTTLDLLARATNFASADLRKTRYAIVGGEPMPHELILTWQKKGVPIRQGFGLTEFGPGAFSLDETDAVRKIGSIGIPNARVEARIVDEQDQDVPDETVGELILKGEACTPGYWRAEAATNAAIKRGWFYTGDLARKDGDGFYFIVGRKKEMFISGGENVSPAEIEHFIATHPAVREVAVVGIPDLKWGEAAKAVIVLNSGAQLSEDELIQFCREGLAKYKVPRQIEFRSELPKSASGKILKNALVN